MENFQPLNIFGKTITYVNKQIRLVKAGLLKLTQEFKHEIETLRNKNRKKFKVGKLQKLFFRF